MAKDYIKGDAFRLYLDTASDWASPTWVEIKAYSEPSIDPGKTDVTIEPQTEETGHMHGKGDPKINFTLHNDKGDTNVETLIANSLNGTLTHLAISEGNIATTGTKYWHMEALLMAPESAGRGDVSQYDVEAMRHANSDNPLTRSTAA